jgi:hypothetical protein
MAPTYLSTYLTLSTYLAIAYAGTSAWIEPNGARKSWPPSIYTYLTLSTYLPIAYAGTSA